METTQFTIAVYIGTSLDGFIARSDGSIDWLDSPFELEGEDCGCEALGLRIPVQGAHDSGASRA